MRTFRLSVTNLAGRSPRIPFIGKFPIIENLGDLYQGVLGLFQHVLQGDNKVDIQEETHLGDDSYKLHFDGPCSVV